MPQRRCGRSGVLLPAITLGLWQNFGSDRPYESAREIVLHAFDAGVFHFDLANNYGPPYGHAEEVFGRILQDGLSNHRDELLISTKAGYDMWPGPFGIGGSRKYLMASLDQSLRRMNLEYVDIFYSHRYDPDTPLEETMGALADTVRQGKAVYAGVSSYSPTKTREAAALLRQMGVPLLIHQPSYSLFNRWIEDGLLDTLEDEGIGCIAFSVLAQGLATNRYLGGRPPESRAEQGGSFDPSWLKKKTIARIGALNDIAIARDQSLAQMAIAWALRDERVTSALIGASTVAQLDDSLGAIRKLDFTKKELKAIDRQAVDLGVDLWKTSRLAG
ncbi:MAG TPA: aldo/keto reductase [Acidimicrobiia bacterium]